MRKCANISPYMRRPLVMYYFGTAPLWISLYMRKIWFSFLSVYIPRIKEYNWIAHRGGGEDPSRAGQVRTVCTLSYVWREVTLNLRACLEKLFMKSEELGPMQRKSHLQVEIIWKRILPPPLHWDRRAIQPNSEIYYPRPLLFYVAQGIFWLSSDWFSCITWHLKVVGEERGVCTLVLCSLATVMSCIGQNPWRWDLYLYFQSLWPTHIKFRTCSALAPMWTPPINESGDRTRGAL